jgi:hypothetical protein
MDSINSDRIDKISPVNAHHILDTNPNRFYTKPESAEMLDITTQVVVTGSRKRIAIIGVCYNPGGMIPIETATYLLHEDGKIE